LFSMNTSIGSTQYLVSAVSKMIKRQAYFQLEL
jgi:hypothetical protein